MKLTKVSLTNYKSLTNIGPFDLAPGFNIVIGPNNVGKSAFLEGLSLRFSAHPYRDPAKPPTHPRDPQSRAQVTVTVSSDDIRTAMLNRVVSNIPLHREAHTAEDAQKRLKSILSVSEVPITFTRNSDDKWNVSDIPPSKGFRQLEIDGPVGAAFSVDFDTGSFRFDGPANHGQPCRTFLTEIAKYHSRRIYAFRAERLNVDKCGNGTSAILKPDASNLAEVVHHFQTMDLKKFEQLNLLTTELFPNVLHVSSGLARDNANLLELLIWPTDPRSGRDDLAMKLSECGTGVGQVLAILSVVVGSDNPTCIIIDEPNSFLHPGAAKKLIQILRSYPQHQYIISTHSPEIIKAANPEILFLMRWKEARSIVEIVPADDLVQQREILSELGVSLSDVFGADNVLWVEGPTEKECFPLIRNQLCAQSLLGTSIVPMHATSDFENRRLPPAMVFRLYTILSQGNALLPPAVGFIFDLERRSESEILDLSRESRGRARFLKRRMYENYLLNPKAVADVLNSLQLLASMPVTVDAVLACFKKYAADPNKGGYKFSDEPFSDIEWITNVDGARLLKAVFWDLSSQRNEYEKITHGIALTNWILAHAPDDLGDLVELLKLDDSTSP